MSMIFSVFVVYSHHKHSKYIAVEYNCAHCLSDVFLSTASKTLCMLNKSLAPLSVCTQWHYLPVFICQLHIVLFFQQHNLKRVCVFTSEDMYEMF